MVENIIDLSERLIAVIYKVAPRFDAKFYEIFDKNTSKKVLSETGKRIFITSFSDGKFVKIKDDKIALMNENLEILKEAYLQNYEIIEVINENFIIAIAVDILKNVQFLNFNNGCTKCYFTFKPDKDIRSITKLDDSKFACLTYRNLKIYNYEGKILQDIHLNKDYNFCSLCDFVNDSSLILTRKHNFNNSGSDVLIWNIDLDEAVREYSNCHFVGTCSFGIFLRPNDEENPLVLHAYRLTCVSAYFIGIITTDTISSSPINRVTHFGNDLYSFEFENGFKIVKCKF
jgi:hypothetical protein